MELFAAVEDVNQGFPTEELIESSTDFLTTSHDDATQSNGKLAFFYD